MPQKSDRGRSFSPWPYRLAVGLVGTTFPLIFVGGLVTTTDAGMAVPDWPNTYNYNMFAYPMRDWFFGPWDLFVEHGHRQLGSLSGLLSLGLLAAVWFLDRRRWARIWAIFVVILVIGQGVLGGVRVLLDDRMFALVHGCVGPTFLAVAVAMAVFTSRWWREERGVIDAANPAVRRAGAAAWILLVASLAQLILGATLRHIPLESDPTHYPHLLVWHLAGAILIAVTAAVGVQTVFDAGLRGGGLRTGAVLLATAIALQIGLGLTTYVVKFGFPPGWNDRAWSAGYVIAEKSMAQTSWVTAHVAVGSLIVALAARHFVRFQRACYNGRRAAGVGSRFGRESRSPAAERLTVENA